MTSRCLIIVAMSVVVAATSCPTLAFSQTDTTDRAIEQAYKDYVQAWKVKDIAALERLMSDDYMAVNFEGKVSDKSNEIATAKADADWISMTVDEIHTRAFGNTAIATGLISAQGKKPDGNNFNAKVRFLAALVKRDNRWQLVATQSSSFKAPQHN